MTLSYFPCHRQLISSSNWKSCSFFQMGGCGLERNSPTNPTDIRKPCRAQHFQGQNPDFRAQPAANPLRVISSSAQ